MNYSKRGFLRRSSNRRLYRNKAIFFTPKILIKKCWFITKISKRESPRF